MCIRDRYYAILTLVAERGYKFNHDSIWIVTNPQVEYTSIDLDEGRYLTLKYTLTTGEITNTTDNTYTSASDSGTDDSQEAVSYTHLDVYKRQQQYRRHCNKEQY